MLGDTRMWIYLHPELCRLFNIERFIWYMVNRKINQNLSYG